VKRYVDESGSAAVRAVLERQPFVTSRLSEVEIASGLARRSREGELSPGDLARALSSLRGDIRSIALIELDEEVIGEAVVLLTRHRLRAADSVQLASCLWLRRQASEDVRLLSYDDRLNTAARAEGMVLSPGRS
jgi:predicted nucleic acid-binding protein